MSRYDALTAELKMRTEPQVVFTFDEIDSIVGGLPSSAKKYPEWWTNNESSQPHSRAWLRAGRRAKPDFHRGHAVFKLEDPRSIPAFSAPGQMSSAAISTPSNARRNLVGESDWLQRIKKIGFAEAGKWLLVEGGIAFELNDLASARNILYAFLVGDELAYIGKSTQSLRARMAGYKTPGPTQITNIRNNKKIREVLAGGGSVRILALPDSGLLYYGGFHINLAAGLEDSLVRDLAPLWNGGRKESLDGSLEPAAATESIAAAAGEPE